MELTTWQSWDPNKWSNLVIDGDGDKYTVSSQNENAKPLRVGMLTKVRAQDDKVWKSLSARSITQWWRKLSQPTNN